ncbi:MAG: phospholipid carrier-dependent glycosyltransferase [Chloroflexota bacterium]|nr:phospholipid carrier-dependent glycosyltransferase [Chloroflexota bacterium]
MNSRFKNLIEKPIYILLAANILVGFLVFRDYGFSWDEPLFYNYADALGYAYSPTEWFSGHFDVDNSYGASGDDHKTRGPAYLFLAREPVYLLASFGLDSASAWHLVNFLFFQLGVYFLYRLSTRWISPSAALAAAALFSWQPLLWGHAFINPKDPPFLVFFLASVCLGFEMVDNIANDTKTSKQKFLSLILAAIFLGITTSIRVLGPLAGLLVLIYFVRRILQEKKSRVCMSPWLMFISYGFIAIIAMFLTWPFLWESPVSRFLEVLKLMSDNPTNLSVLFAGDVYRAGELPRRYLPFMLATTLTEPVWFLFICGIFIGYWKLFTEDSPMKTHKLTTLTLTLLWFLLLVAYVLIRRPSMYDGLRHFLFILPPVFILTGFAFEFLFQHIALNWLRAAIVLVLFLPGLAGIFKLHPYEYTYYNSLIGGTSQAFRNYETDYWLTCYKEAVEAVDKRLDEPFNLYVHREVYIAEYYADAETNIHELRGAVQQVRPGDHVLVNTRTNEDRRVFKDAETVLQIGRGDAVFCMIKRIP